MENLTTPLTDEEFEQLFELLDRDDFMDISTLHGFLTAVRIGPVEIATSDWLPLVWGEAAVFDSEAQAEELTSLVFRLANEVTVELAEERFEPILYENEDEEQGPVLVLEPWCRGFMRGAGLAADAWQPIYEGEGKLHMLPMLLHGTDGGDERRDDKPTGAMDADLLARCVAEVDRFWAPKRG